MQVHRENTGEGDSVKSEGFKKCSQEVIMFDLRNVYLVHLSSSDPPEWGFCFDQSLLLSSNIYPLNFELPYHD